VVAFGEEQQAARRFEFEKAPARAERADHHGARRCQRLLGRPQAFFPFAGADQDKTLRIEPELQEAWRVWRTVFGEHAFLADPEHAARPAGGEPEAEAQRGRFRPRPGRDQFVQRLGGHSH